MTLSGPSKRFIWTLSIRSLTISEPWNLLTPPISCAVRRSWLACALRLLLRSAPFRDFSRVVRGEIRMLIGGSIGEISGDFYRHFYCGIWIAAQNRDDFLGDRDETHFSCGGCQNADLE
jgi:hypothetical protein